MTPDQYITATPEPKRSELRELHRLIQRVAPSFEPYTAGTMIGYGRYRYRYESGREGESCRIGLAANASGISVYVTCVHEGRWLAETWKDRLGKANVGKSCIRFKRLADIDVAALASVLKIARGLRAPGEITAGTATPATSRTAAKKPAATKTAATKTAAKKTAAKKTASPRSKAAAAKAR
ncbi:MAG: DUF1801 domain-containing protein [Labilithrix sp.]|nr:DUF1801 domain-containing protein [Labilithrix sp.]